MATLRWILAPALAACVDPLRALALAPDSEEAHLKEQVLSRLE